MNCFDQHEDKQLTAEMMKEEGVWQVVMESCV